MHSKPQSLHITVSLLSLYRFTSQIYTLLSIYYSHTSFIIDFTSTSIHPSTKIFDPKFLKCFAPQASFNTTFIFPSSTILVHIITLFLLSFTPLLFFYRDFSSSSCHLPVQHHLQSAVDSVATYYKIEAILHIPDVRSLKRIGIQSLMKFPTLMHALLFTYKNTFYSFQQSTTTYLQFQNSLQSLRKNVSYTLCRNGLTAFIFWTSRITRVPLTNPWPAIGGSGSFRPESRSPRDMSLLVLLAQGCLT